MRFFAPLPLGFAIAGCAAATPPDASVQVAALAVTAAGCLDPGAVPNDGLSDRVAIQSALDAAGAAGGTVCLPPGRFTLERAPIGSYNRFAALSTHGRNVTLRGAGPETVLELVGDQGASGVAVLSIDPSAQHIQIVDLTIDTSAAMNTDEQTHAIATSGVCAGSTCQPIVDLQVERVAFVHPRNTTSRKGDCLKLLGNAPATEVYRVRVIGNDFADCARAAVTLQRGLHDVVIANNTIHCETCDQAIDGEATGGGFDYGVVIQGNTFSDGASVQGDFSVAMTNGVGVVIAENTMPRGVALYRTTDAVIAHNTILADAMKTDVGLIDVSNVCDGLVVSENRARRGGHVGPMIKLVPHSGGLCGDAVVNANNLTQGTAFHAIYGETLIGTSISANKIRYTVTAPAYSAIYVRSVVTTSPVVTLGISSNVISGDVGPTHAVTLDCTPGSCGRGISVSSNTAANTTFGLHINGANLTAPITSSGNTCGADAYGSAQVVHGG